MDQAFHRPATRNYKIGSLHFSPLPFRSISSLFFTVYLPHSYLPFQVDFSWLWNTFGCVIPGFTPYAFSHIQQTDQSFDVSIPTPGRPCVWPSMSQLFSHLMFGTFQRKGLAGWVVTLEFIVVRAC